MKTIPYNELYDMATPEEREELLMYGIESASDIPYAVEEFGEELNELLNIIGANDEFFGQFKDKFKEKWQTMKANRQANEGGLFSGLKDKVQNWKEKKAAAGNPMFGASSKGGFLDKVKGLAKNAGSVLGILDKNVVNKDDYKAKAEYESALADKQKKQRQTVMIAGGIGLTVVLVIVLVLVNKNR